MVVALMDTIPLIALASVRSQVSLSDGLAADTLDGTLRTDKLRGGGDGFSTASTVLLTAGSTAATAAEASGRGGGGGCSSSGDGTARTGFSSSVRVSSLAATGAGALATSWTGSWGAVQWVLSRSTSTFLRLPFEGATMVVSAWIGK